MSEFSAFSRGVFKVAVGFVVGVLIMLAGTLFLSNQYLNEQRQLAAAGDVEAALERLRLAARLSPFDPAPLANQAFLLQQQGQTQLAVRAFEEAIRRDPGNFVNYVSLGNLQLNGLGDPEAAAKSYRGALERSPKSTDVRASLAAALVGAGNLEAAKREYETLAAAGRITLGDQISLGKVYARTGEPERAVETLRDARERVAGRLERLQNLGKAEEETVLDFLDSVDLAIADALIVQGDYEGAREVLEGSRSEQAPAILELLRTNPEMYRESVLDGEI